VSSTEKAFGLLKTWMLVNERFDGIDAKLKDLNGDLSALGRSHADLGQRVALIEGYIRGRADQAAAQAPRVKDQRT
jgi:hypothetical protein